MTSENETQSGVVVRVFFANPESPFMAGILKTENGEIRFSGKVVAESGDKLELVGKWTNHPKYGAQFEAETGIVKMDESPDALIHLLATDKRFKNIGPARARAVVEAASFLSNDGDLGTSLTEFAEEIALRSGVHPDIVNNAAKVWSEKRSYFDALALLCDQGWSNAQAQTIVSVLGENAPHITKDNPYGLIGKIPRFGFRTVDTVAIKMGVKETDPLRLMAGICYCLDRIGENGDTYTTREAIIDEANKELRPNTIDAEDLIEDCLNELITSGLVYLDHLADGQEIVADTKITNSELYVFSRIYAGLQGTADKPVLMSGPRSQEVLGDLNQGQTAAVYGFSNHKFGIISGGAGVGKTFTMSAVCEIADENKMRIGLCAPTGKASQKLQQATGRRACTIHRILEPKYNPETGVFGFTRNAHNKLELDLLIVDEISMVDVRLMKSLLVALPDDCRLLMVGDHHQIPSVGAGAILRDILAAKEKFPGAIHILTEIVRQAGVLARNTTSILGGVVVLEQVPAWGVVKTEHGDEVGAANIVAQMVEYLVTQPVLEPFKKQLDLAWDVQVLAPMRKGPLGTYNLNVHLQKVRQRLLGNPAPEPTEENKAPKPLVGDRIIWNGQRLRAESIQRHASYRSCLQEGRSDGHSHRRRQRSYGATCQAKKRRAGVCNDHPQVPGIGMARGCSCRLFETLDHARPESSVHRSFPSKSTAHNGWRHQRAASVCKREAKRIASDFWETSGQRLAPKISATGGQHGRPLLNQKTVQTSRTPRARGLVVLYLFTLRGNNHGKKRPRFGL